MRIYTKILLASLPLVLFSLLAGTGLTYFGSPAYSGNTGALAKNLVRSAHL